MARIPTDTPRIANAPAAPEPPRAGAPHVIKPGGSGRTRRRMARLRGFCGFEPGVSRGAIHVMGSALPNSFPKAEPLPLGYAETSGFSSYAPHGRLARSHEGCEPGRARPPGAPCLPAHPSLLLLYACSRGPSRHAFPRTFPSSRSPPASLTLYRPARLRAFSACFLLRPQGLPSPAHSHSKPRRRKRRRRGKQFTRPARERSERRGPPGVSGLRACASAPPRAILPPFARAFGTISSLNFCFLFHSQYYQFANRKS